MGRFNKIRDWLHAKNPEIRFDFGRKPCTKCQSKMERIETNWRGDTNGWRCMHCGKYNFDAVDDSKIAKMLNEYRSNTLGVEAIYV